jgi:hypothetical protein
LRKAAIKCRCSQALIVLPLLDYKEIGRRHFVKEIVRLFSFLFCFEIKVAIMIFNYKADETFCTIPLLVSHATQSSLKTNTKIEEALLIIISRSI